MAETKTETTTFRLDAALKAELKASAAARAMGIGGLMRELMRDRIEQNKRRY